MSFIQELKRRNVVRVALAYCLIAWILLQGADFGLDLVDAPNWVIQSLFVIALLGLPAAIVFSWVYEMTPEGIQKEAEIDREESVTPQTGRKLDRIIIAALGLTVVLLLANQFMSGDQEPGSAPDTATVTEPAVAVSPQETSIAVLPFVNMSADEDNEYFSDGISEELLNVLVRVSALEVASRTSSFAYKGKDIPISQIAKDLGVDHVLEGSVRKAGNRVRVTAQLIDARTDRHLWSDTYDRELDDIFGIQEEISNSIVAALKLALDVDEVAAMERLQRPTDNTEAYELYLQGRYQWRLRLEENIRASIESFEAAIALDPGFAKAHEGLAAAWTVLPFWSPTPTQDVAERAVASADQALALDPLLGEATAIRAHFLQVKDDWIGALEEFRRASVLEPRNATVTQWHAEFLGDAGYLREGLEMAQKAYQLDPASRVINLINAHLATMTMNDELSIRHAEIALDLGMNPRRATFNAFDAYWRQGQEAVLYERMIDQTADSPLVKACGRAILAPEGDEDLNEILALDPLRARSTLGHWCAQGILGDVDVALDVLEPLVREDLTGMDVFWFQKPMNKKIRGTDRFKAFLASTGIVDLWRAKGWPDLCQPSGEDEFTCE